MVYVDTARHAYGRMIMCHMLADTPEELHEMAERIGVARKHYQGDHYDICQQMRTKAVLYSATEVTTNKELSEVIKRVRSNPAFNGRLSRRTEPNQPTQDQPTRCSGPD